MIIKTTRKKFEYTSGLTLLVDVDIFLPTVTAVRCETISLRGASPQGARVYAQEGEDIEGRSFLALMNNGKVLLVAGEKGWFRL